MRAHEIFAETKLVELFDSTSSIEWIENDAYMKRGYFQVGETKFSIEIYAIDNEKNIWGVLYGNIDNGAVRFRPTHQAKGDAPKILGTVVNEIFRFIEQHKPNALVFSGAKGYGLHRLYELMLKNLDTKVISLGYKVEQGVEDDTSKFAILKDEFDNYNQLAWGD